MVDDAKMLAMRLCDDNQDNCQSVVSQGKQPQTSVGIPLNVIFQTAKLLMGIRNALEEPAVSNILCGGWNVENRGEYPQTVSEAQ